MRWRRKRLVLGLALACCAASPVSAQITYLDKPILLAQVDSCLRYTYGCSFDKARSFLRVLENRTPRHPAPAFLEALITYWEHFPLTPASEASAHFIALMDTVIARAQPYIARPESRTEGVFFDLFGMAFKAMYYADNGKPGKVVPDLRSMYRHTLEGFNLRKELSEFYFSTGLYLYYIEAFPEAHPVYKPLLSFMQDGNKPLGLQELNLAIHQAVYLRTEAILFMSLIHLNYEEDLLTASMYAERLFREFPANPYYQGHLLIIQLHRHRFSRVRSILAQMKGQNDAYSQLLRTLAHAFLNEMETKDAGKAAAAYRLVIEQSQSIGPFANNFQAMAYMGLSRIAASGGRNGEARRHAKKADNLTTFAFILDETGGGSR